MANVNPFWSFRGTISPPRSTALKESNKPEKILEEQCTQPTGPF